MAQHKLSLEIPDILNDCALRIVDSSIYDPLVPQLCPRLYVTPPGFDYSTEFTNKTPGFSVNLSACDMQIQVKQCGINYDPIPDGIYVVKWSLAPNDVVFVEYNHLRITQALIAYKKLLCCLELAGCEPPIETKEKLKKLRYIRDLLYAAKAKVEFCHQVKDGMDIYTYALKLLGKVRCQSC